MLTQSLSPPPSLSGCRPFTVYLPRYIFNPFVLFYVLTEDLSPTPSFEVPDRLSSLLSAVFSQSYLGVPGCFSGFVGEFRENCLLRCPERVPSFNLLLVNS